MILARLIRQGMKIRYLCFGLGAIALQLDWFVEGRSHTIAPLHSIRSKLLPLLMLALDTAALNIHTFDRQYLSSMHRELTSV
jgi:hypothetical protein